MSDRGVEARGHASRLSRTIKPAIETRSFFAFLLREHARVREFGGRTHVLEAGFLPPGMKLDLQLTAFFARDVQGWAGELSSRLAPVLENGWVYLTPRQYNLLVLVKRLCGRLSAFDFSRLNLRDRNLVDRLRRIESLFLTLQYDPESLGVILAALRIHHEKRNEGQGEIDASQGLVIRLLTEDCTLPSFYDCIIGFNIFKHRRFLSLSDLMREGLGETVDIIGFDCEPKVRERIESYVAETVTSMKDLHGQLREARLVNRYVMTDDQERPQTAALWEVYKAGESRQSVDFDADQENLVPFLSRLIRGFDRIFSPLLNGTCVLSVSGRAAIFSRSFFELELTRLRTLAGKLERDVFHVASFPMHRYLRLRKARKEAVANEGEVTDLIGESVGCLVDIGLTLSKVLSTRSGTGTEIGPAAGQAGPGPLQPIVLRGKPFVLPHENERLRAAARLTGKTVAEALAAAATVCFTTGMLFQDDFVSMFIGKDQKLQDELQQRMKLVETLLDPEKYRELAAELV